MTERTYEEKAIIRRDLEAGKITPDRVPKALQILGLPADWKPSATPAPSPQPTAPVGPPGVIEITKERPDATPDSPRARGLSLSERLGEQMIAPNPRGISPTVEAVTPARQQQPLMESEDLSKMAAALGINLAGAGIGARLGSLTGPYAAAGIPFGAMLGSLVAREVNKRWKFEEPGIGGDIIAAAAPWLGMASKEGKNLQGTLLRYSRAGRAMTAAEEATQTAREAWSAQTREFGVKEAAGKYAAREQAAQQTLTDRSKWAARVRELGVDEAIAKQAATEKAAQQTLTDRSKWAARTREMQVDYAREMSEAAQEARQATADLTRAYQTKQADAYTEALEKAKDATARWRRAVQNQRQTAERAQALPGTMTPPITAADLYAEFAQDFGARAVTMMDANAAAARVLNQLGGHFEALQQPRMQAIATEMLATQHIEVAQVHQWLKDLGPMTRHRDSTVRGAARQLYAGLQESLTTVPGAPASLRAANAAARREFALDDLERFIRRAVHGTGQTPRLNGERLAEQVRIRGAEDPLFRGSFSDAEWNTLTTNLDALAELSPTAARPVRPGNIPVKSVGPPPRVVAPKAVPEPQYPPFPPEQAPRAVAEPQYRPFPPDVDPREHLSSPSLGRLATWGTIGGIEAAMQGHIGPFGIGMLALATVDVTGYGLARVLLTPGAQPWLRKMITPAGTLDPRVMAIFSAAARLPWAATTSNPQGATP